MPLLALCSTIDPKRPLTINKKAIQTSTPCWIASIQFHESRGNRPNYIGIPNVWCSQFAGEFHGKGLSLFPSSFTLTQPDNKASIVRHTKQTNSRLLTIALKSSLPMKLKTQKKNNVFISRTWNARAAANAKNEMIMQIEKTFMTISPP